MSIREKIILGAVSCVLVTAAAGLTTPVLADGAGAFIGGVFAAKVVGNMQRQTEAQEQQAAYASQAAYAPAPVPAAPAQKSPQQRINELDKLAAGGYITPEEYKAKKKAILDSM